MFVIDANVLLTAASSPQGFKAFGRQLLVAPPLLWPEARSALHTALGRRLVTRLVAERCLMALESGRVDERAPDDLGREAWRVADVLGWTKTYDAEYLALARLLDTRLVTLDGRMLSAAQRLDIPATSAP